MNWQQGRISPLPAIRGGGYRERDYWVWCASPVQSEDGRFHLFASRIPKSMPFHPAWLYASEIVRAEAETVEGPYQFKEVILGARDAAFFDGRSAHNPCIRKVGTRYLLYYLGCTYPGREVDPAGELAAAGGAFYTRTWARKRIGMAWADNIDGPWHRPDKPLLEPRAGNWDAIATTNPAPWILADGSVVMVYKSRTVTGGPRLLGLAGAVSWDGVYGALMDAPLFPDIDVEDPCMWHDKDGFHMILKDMTGVLGGEPGCLVLAHSHDAKSWSFPDKPFFHGKRLAWDDGSFETVGNFERPQLLFGAAGQPTHLFAAISRGGRGIGDATETQSICLPLHWIPGS